jgi:hypothetical protein
MRKTITPTFLRFVPLTHSSAMATVNAPPKLRTASDIHVPRSPAQSAHKGRPTTAD